MLLFAKTGLAKNIQDAITNTVNHLLDEGNKAAEAPKVGGGFILYFFQKEEVNHKSLQRQKQIFKCKYLSYSTSASAGVFGIS